MRVVFWGTPQLADTTLSALIAAGHDLVGVVTQPDRPAGRGRKMQPPPVKLTAEEAGIPVLQPEKPWGDEFMTAFRALEPDITVVAAYGHILKPEVLELPPLGSFNVHASLLPKLRGAAPVNWAIIRGHAETGVTIMRMVEKLDAGPMILQAGVEIAARTTAGALYAELAELGARTLLDALPLIEAGEVTEEAQDEAEATYAPKLTADDVRLDWSLTGQELDRWIRGCDPVPGCWTELDGARVRVFSPCTTDETAKAEPGVVVSADPRAGLVVATGSELLRVGEVQPAGKRRMEAVEWIRGRGVMQGARFG
ncbi:MAG: methionyl-tRNA formyltransferase [Gemmatimonadetes bacterium]|nr:methionyl-tRNA formyltransferase [Gemmatimonadota bacterium]NIO31586.1 methionyl-tRNA formyltransferase [Gemmatimonadota bacterium]